MTTYIPPKKNTQYIFYAGLVSQSTGQFQVNPTLATGDFKVSIDGGALANMGTLPAVTPAGSRMVKFTLSNTEMNGDNITVIGYDSDNEWDEIIVSIPTSTLQIDDLATPTNITAGTITTVTNLTNAPTNGDLTATMKTSVANAVLDADMTGHQTQGTLGQAIGDPAADTNTIYKAVVTDAAGATVGVDIVAVKTETASIQTDTNDIQTRLPASLVSGRMDVSVGAMAANVVTASAVAADAVTEIQSGLATSAALATVQADTDNIQTRLPAALSGDGFMKADLKSIEDELTNGNNATLNLRALNIQTNVEAEPAVYIQSSTGAGMDIRSNNYDAIDITGLQGIVVTADYGIKIDAYIDALLLNSNTGKSINAPQGIFGSDSDDLSVTNITDKVWDEAIAGHLSAGSTGEKLNDAGAAGNPWSENLPGSYTAGQAGYIVGTNLDVTVSSRLADSDFVSPPLATENAETLLKYDLSTITGEASRSVVNALRKLRNKVSFATGTLSIKKEDDVTNAYTQSVTQDSDQEPFKSVG